MAASPAAALAPIQIPQRASPRRTRDPSGARQRRHHSPALAMAASAVLIALVMMEFWTPDDASEDVKEWSFWVVQLVFPSHHITWLKLVGLALGFVLTTSYFLTSQSQLALAEKMMIRSATVLVSPLRRSESKPMTNDPNAPTPTGKTTAAWLSSRCQSLLHSHQFGITTGTDGHEDEIPQLKIRDECKARTSPLPLGSNSEFESVNRAQPIAFESEYFSGHVLFMVKDSTKPTSGAQRGNWAHLFGSKKRMLWVQVQGRFKRPLPPRAVLYLATELPAPDGFQVAFLTRQLVSLIITLVKKFVPTAHVSFGEKASSDGESELPHAAFPLYQTVDEFVVTDACEGEKAPSFGQDVFGEPAEAKKRRALTPVGMEPPVRLDAVYSFQFHTMYSDLAQWKIVNVPGMPDMELKRFCGTQPIQLAIYAMTTPGLHPGILCDLPHKANDKGYLFCFSMHHTSVRDSGTIASPTQRRDDQSDATLRLSTRTDMLSPTASSPLRWRSVSCDQPEAIIRQQSRGADVAQTKEERLSEVSAVEARPQPRIRASSSVRNMTSIERAADLSNWSFSLPLWIERVDPVAGNRKVAYLFVVEERQSTATATAAARRCVVRSAQTVKNALLLLDTAELGDHTREFKKLIIESREFLYDSISRETDQVAHVLQAIAAIPPEQATELDKDKKAMLFNCLMSESQLPCIRSFQDIGIQLSKAKREQMDIIFEKGVYRMLDPRFMRQEWIILTTTELHFFRSFTLKPSKTVQLTHVLGIQNVDEVSFLEAAPAGNKTEEVVASSPRQRVRNAAMRATNRWFCVEIQVLTEVLTVFFDSASDRALCVSSLTQLIKLKAGGSAANSSGRLPPPRPLDAVTTPLCCNQRRRLPIAKERTGRSPVAVVEEMAERGLRLYSRPRQDAAAADVVAFLDAVDQLGAVELVTASASSTVSHMAAAEWFPSDESLLAFALNLYHVLFVHAWLLFGDVRSHTAWKKLKAIVFYSIGDPRTPGSQVRLTLGDMEHTLLQARPAPGDETRGAASSAAHLPAFLVATQRDFRTSLALQTNIDPLAVQTLRVYHAATLSSELKETCARFLEREVVVDDAQRVIYLPKLCESNVDAFPKGSPVVQPSSRAFFCLQKLIPLMATLQHDRIQHVLLGAGKEYQIRFSPRFWTQEQVRSSLPAEATSEHVGSGAVAIHSSDDSSIPSVSSTNAAAATDGMPRSKSALQFFQSLF